MADDIDMAVRPSALYRQALAEAKAHHATAKTYSGRFLRPHKPYLSGLIKGLGIRTALDIGAGKGRQYTWIDPADGLTLEQAWRVRVTKYDPAWAPFAAEPKGQFDLVICTHTLGSIPIEDHHWFIPRLIGFATKAVYIAEKIGPIKKGVHGDREGFATGWTRGEWVAQIRRHLPPQWSGAPIIILSTTERVNGEKVTERAAL